MKHEESKDLTTLLVEATDEKVAVVRWVREQDRPVVVVLPESSVFRRPGDLLELRRASVRQTAPLSLVISGNERLRTWAHRQGFSVYSSTASCAKALTQSRVTQPLQKIQASNVALAVREATAIVLRDTEPLAKHKKQPVMQIQVAGRRWQETLLLILVVLLVLGILGGVGFGYLLASAHSTQPVSPASFLSQFL